MADDNNNERTAYSISFRGIDKIPEADRGAFIERHQKHSIEAMRWKSAAGIVSGICFTVFVCTCMVVNCG